MKMTVAREALIAGLQKVQAIVNPHQTLPVLSNLLFVAENDELTLTGTDLDVTVQARIKAQVTRAGRTTLPAKRLLPIARDLPHEEAEIQGNDKDQAEIRSGSAFFRLNGLAAEDFPQTAAIEKPRLYNVEQKLFKAMLLRTGYAVSRDDSRPVLNGVLMSFRNEKLTVVATDGRRMALVEHELEFPQADEADYILPIKSVNELIPLLQDTGTLKVEAGANRVSFTGEDFVFSSKLTEGMFPNYRQVIPEACEQRVTIERESFMHAVRRVALLTDEKSNVVKMMISRNSVEVTAATPDVGEARESVPVKYSGEKIEISFNPDYLIDPLKNLVTDEIFFEMRDDTSPGVIKSDDPFLYVIMPIRVA